MCAQKDPHRRHHANGHTLSLLPRRGASVHSSRSPLGTKHQPGKISVRGKGRCSKHHKHFGVVALLWKSCRMVRPQVRGSPRLKRRLAGTNVRNKPRILAYNPSQNSVRYRKPKFDKTITTGCSFSASTQGLTLFVSL